MIKNNKRIKNQEFLLCQGYEGRAGVRACPAKLKRSGGFTLIEMLVSMAIFALVIVVILGAIMSIVDANKKARTLMTVMNNLNFTVESMTRSFKTGEDPYVSGNCFETTEIDYGNTVGANNLNTRIVEYCIENGQITKESGTTLNPNSLSGNPSALTSPDIEITGGSFELRYSNQVQPLLLINLEGEVKIGGNISSAFSIQTAVSQRKLQR